jgi:prevent-host-death family protein
MAVEQQVSKSRFKARALEYLRGVQETGQPVVILDRGRPVVKVVPYRGEANEILRVLQGSVRRYEQPTKPVAVEDWEAVR